MPYNILRTDALGLPEQYMRKVHVKSSSKFQHHTLMDRTKVPAAVSIAVAQQATIILGFPGVGKSTITKEADRYTPMEVFDEPNYAKGREEKFFSELLKLSTQQVVLLLPAHRLRDAKAEYLERYRYRGNSTAFVELIDKKWDPFVDNMFYPHGDCEHIELQNGQFLEAVFSRILKNSC